MWEHLFAKKNYRIGETYNMKGNAMNSDDRLECLRLAVELEKSGLSGLSVENIIKAAQEFYNWVYKTEKPNKLTFEKVNKERE